MEKPIPARVYLYDRGDPPQYLAIALDPAHADFNPDDPPHSGVGAIVDTGTNWYTLKRKLEKGGAEVVLSQALQSDEQDMNDDIAQGAWPFGSY